MEEFSIELGAKLKLDSLQEQINKASSDLKPLEITINTEKSKEKIELLTKQIDNLHDKFKNNQPVNSLANNLDVINKSLRSIATVIDKINKADGFNNLGKGLSSFAPVAEMIKNELSSIKTAMESFKGLNINIGLGGTNNQTAYNAANRMALAELRQQETALESAYGGFLNMSRRLNSSNLWNLKDIADDSTAGIQAQVTALQQYINAILAANTASARGIDLTPITSTFSGSANEIVANVNRIATGEQNLTNQTNQLKGLFGSGIDSEKLTKQLDAIKVSIDNVSTAISGIKFDDSTLNSFENTIQSLNNVVNQLNQSINTLNNNPLLPKTNNLLNNNLPQQMKQSGNNAGQQFANGFNGAINGIDLHNGGIGHVNGMLQQLGFDRKSLGVITENLGNMKLKIDNIKTTMLSSGNIRLTVTGQDELMRSVQIVRDFDKETGNIINTSKSFIQNFAQQETQIQRNTTAITNYTTKLEKLRKDYEDKNAPKPIQDESHLKRLNDLRTVAINQVNALNTANKENYSSMDALAKQAISNLETEIRLLRNEEYAANQLRAKPIEAIKSEQVELLRKFKAEIEASGITFNKFKTFNIGQLSGKVSGIADKQSLMEYLNSLSIAQAEFKALQAEQKNYSQMQKASADKEKAALKEVEDEYQNLISLVGQIGKKRISLFGLDSESEKDIPKITRIKEELRDLYTQYAKSKMTFTINFPTYNLDELKVKWQEILRSIELAKNETIGNEEINKKATAYKELLSSFDKYKAERIALSKINPQNPKYDVVREEVLRLATDYRKLRAEFSKTYPTHNLDELRDKLHSLSYELRQVQGDNVNKAKQQAEKTEQEKVNSAYRETLDLLHQIQSIQVRITELDPKKNSSEILTLNEQLKKLQKSYTALRTEFNSKFDTSQINQLNLVAQTTIDKMAIVQAKIDDVKASSVRSIKDNISNGTLENQIQTIENDYRKLGLTQDEIAQKTQTLKTLLNAMDASDDIESVTKDYTTFGQEVVKVQNDVKALHREQQKSKDEANLANGKNTLSSQIDVWLKKNSAAASEFGVRLREIQQELLTADGTKLTALKREFQDIKRQAELAGKATMTLGDKLKSKLGSLATYFSATMMISYAIRGIRSMFQNVLQVDTAMTELYRVTDLTEKQYSQLYDKMVAGAKEYGIALNNIIEATASWVRLGFDANTASRLAEITTMYQHVTDLDNDTAVKNLVTAYKGYQEELLQVFDSDSAKAVTKIADAYDKLGNEFAVTAADVGESLRRSASSLEMAGNSFEEAAGMSTGIIEVTQNAEQAGTTLNVVSLRLRGMKGQLEEIGEEVDENVESISKMQTHILNLTNGKVNIFKDNGDFKSTYQIFKEISAIYDNLTDTSRADLLETVAGKQRSNAVAALIGNWSNVEKAVEAASNAEGTAAAENEKYMQSMQGKLDSLNASWQALSNTVLSSDLIKFLVGGLSGIVDIVDGITHSFGVLGTTIGTIGIIAFIKNLD